jgi:hypothetical protein
MSYTREEFEEDFGPIENWGSIQIGNIRIDFIDDVPSKPWDSYYITIRAYKGNSPSCFHEESFVDCGPEDTDDEESWIDFLDRECPEVFKEVKEELVWKESRESLEEKESAVRNGQNSGSSV